MRNLSKQYTKKRERRKTKARWIQRHPARNYPSVRGGVYVRMPSMRTSLRRESKHNNAGLHGTGERARKHQKCPLSPFLP